jgi:DNA (cytosine-5)-methyltransferase 1
MRMNGHVIAGMASGGSDDRPTFIDLFCGCGGFTLGMLRAGFRCLAAIDSSPEAIAVLKANLVAGNDRQLCVDHVLERDLTKYNPSDLADLIGIRRVDVIVGGPPCQGYSLARQVDGANHGKRLKEDARRDLYRELLRFVDHFQPRVFVMENVLGLRSAAGGDYFTRVQKESRELGRSAGRPGYRVHGQIEDAWELGAPQKRRRQLLVGVRADLPGYFLPALKPARRAVSRITLGACIGDLPILRAGSGDNCREYDRERRAEHMRRNPSARRYLKRVAQIGDSSKLTNHVARPHSNRDLRDFARLKEGETSRSAMRRGVKFEFPYDKSSFKDRYTRQSRFKACSTIVAHLSKDGLMFIHPTQNRSLTPREAARVQTFPDWFDFAVSRTHAYRLIGNAVPPVVAEAAGNAIAEFLRTRCAVHVRQPGTSPSATGVNGYHENAARVLQNFAAMSPLELKSLSRTEFLTCWRALLDLLPMLHPVNALDHGVDHERWPEGASILPALKRDLHRRYTRSGWPVPLVSIGKEAWRRLKTRKLTKREIYVLEIHKARRGSMMLQAS